MPEVSAVRARAVALALSREKKNQYTQGAKRTSVASGWSDCSSFVRWCYLEAAGLDIGLNTAAQIQNKALAVADASPAVAPPASALIPGDLLYFKGTDPGRPLGVGHVEMYVGGGKLIGHGSGLGPTRKDMAAYCAARAKAGRGYLRALRPLPDPKKPTEVPKIPTGVPLVEVVGGTVHVRKGPGTAYDVSTVARRGERFERIDAGGWVPVRSGGAALWISGQYVKEV